MGLLNTLQGDNLIEIWDNVEDEALCEDRCRLTSGCNFYTYHRLNSTLFSSTCFLLTELEEPVVPCEGSTCSSGSPDCASTLCSFFQLEGNGTLHPNGIVITETKDVGMVRIGLCPNIFVVAVGGGGEGYFAGGGSGYIQQAELRSYLPYSTLNANVGGSGRSSSVSDGSGNVVSAEGGGDGGESDGGSGYSGGGTSPGLTTGGYAGAGWSLVATWAKKENINTYVVIFICLA